MLAGRTTHWGCTPLRNGAYDFKPYSRDGLGFDWPLTYEELEPYYDRTEALIGVYAHSESLENTPVSRNGTQLPPPAPRAFERLTRKSSASCACRWGSDRRRLEHRVALLGADLAHPRHLIGKAFLRPCWQRDQALE